MTVKTKCHNCGKTPNFLNLTIVATAHKGISDTSHWRLGDAEDGPCVIKATCTECNAEFLPPSSYITDDGSPTLYLDDEFFELLNGQDI